MATQAQLRNLAKARAIKQANGSLAAVIRAELAKLGISPVAASQTIASKPAAAPKAASLKTGPMTMTFKRSNTTPNNVVFTQDGGFNKLYISNTLELSTRKTLTVVVS